MRTATAARLGSLTPGRAVVTSAQLADAGLDRGLPRRQGWVRLAPQTWATSGDVDDRQLLEAIASYAGDDAVASGGLACRRHGLRDVPPSSADALVPHGRRLVGGGRLVLHQTRRMPEAVVVRGARVAPLPRAVADACRWGSSLRDARALVLAAAADRRASHAQLLAELESGPQQGSAHLARALVDLARGASSAPEAEAADCLLATRGLPPLLLNPELRLDGVLLGIPDGYLPAVGVGWELDSLRHHGSSVDLERTLLRHQRFSDAGIEVLHVVPAALRRDPSAFAASVLARAQARGLWQPPAGLLVRPRGPLLAPRR